MTAREFESLRYTKYAEECCQLIFQHAEYPTDVYLVQLVRLLYMADKIGRSLNPAEFDPSSNINAPVGAAVKALEVEVRKLKPMVLHESLQNGKLGPSLHRGMLTGPVLLRVHYYAVEVYLCEIALDDKVEASRYGSFSTTRLSLLFACLESTKAFFETFDTLPAVAAFDIPYSTWTMLSHLNVVLSKLSLCVADGWDPDYVEATVSFHSVLDNMNAKVDEAIEYAKRRRDNDISDNTLHPSVPLIFSTVAMKVNEVKAVHDARRADLSRRHQSMLQPTEAVQVATEGLAVPEDFTMMEPLDFFDFVDEPFWTQPWT